MTDETMPNQPGAAGAANATPATDETVPVATSPLAGEDTPSGMPTVDDSETAIIDDAVDDEDEDEDDTDDDEDEDTVDEEMVMEDETEEAPQSGDDVSTVTLRLSTDLRRRLRRRADREGVSPEELAEELLGAAIRRPAAESLPELVARVEKLERTVLELSAARPRPEAPAPRRSEERPRGDFGSRAPGGFGDRGYDRGPSDRPGYGDRGGYAGPRRQDDRPRFSERPSSGGFGRPEGRFGDRPRNDLPDRGPARPSFDRDRPYDRGESRDRPARRWESPRRGE